MYVCTNPVFVGYCKAGITSLPSRRLLQYQTATPFRDFTFVGSVYFSDAALAERALFRRCRGWRVGNSEWFHQHPDIILDVIHQLKQEIDPNGS